MCMTVDFTNTRLENRKKTGKEMTHTFIKYIIQNKYQHDMQRIKKNSFSFLFFFVTNHKSYLHMRQYSY